MYRQFDLFIPINTSLKFVDSILLSSFCRIQHKVQETNGWSFGMFEGSERLKQQERLFETLLNNLFDEFHSYNESTQHFIRNICVLFACIYLFFDFLEKSNKKEKENMFHSNDGLEFFIYFLLVKLTYQYKCYY